MKSRNKVFLIIVALSLFIISISAVWGHNQVSQKKNDYIKYTQVKESIKSKEDAENAIKELDRIEKKYGESDVIKIDKASIYLKIGDTKNSQKEIERAVKINKTLENNAAFMLAYAQTAFENEDINTVKSIINKLENLELSQDNKNKLAEIKKLIK